MSDQSETPRTYEAWTVRGQATRREVSNQLERELTSANARVKELEQRNGIQSEMIEILRRERDTLRDQNNRLKREQEKP